MRMSLLFTLVALLSVTLSSCGSDDAAPGVASTCHLTSDCATGLICAYGACRQKCAADSDCASGETCTPTPSNGSACVAPGQTAEGAGGGSGASGSGSGGTAGKGGMIGPGPGGSAGANGGVGGNGGSTSVGGASGASNAGGKAGSSSGGEGGASSGGEGGASSGGEGGASSGGEGGASSGGEGGASSGGEGGASSGGASAGGDGGQANAGAGGDAGGPSGGGAGGVDTGPTVILPAIPGALTVPRVAAAGGDLFAELVSTFMSTTMRSIQRCAGGVCKAGGVVTSPKTSISGLSAYASAGSPSNVSIAWSSSTAHTMTRCQASSCGTPNTFAHDPSLGFGSLVAWNMPTLFLDSAPSVPRVAQCVSPTDCVDDGAATVVTVDSGVPHGLAVAQGYLFVLVDETGHSELRSCLLTACSGLVTIYTSTGMIGGVASDGDKLFMTDVGHGGISVCTAPDCLDVATPIAVMESDIGSIAADPLSPWIYWVSDSVGVYRAAK